MPSTVSDAAEPVGRYHFQFAWNSPYGHAVRLLETLRADGALVIDIGCGYGPLAEIVKERGFQYVGCDADAQALGDLQARGFECHATNLRGYAALPDRLVDIAAGRPVHALLLLDVLEHLADTRLFLDAIRAASLRLDRPLLIVSVPNVAHFDLGAKLALGHWDVTASGLLDDTHVQLFTEARLTEELRRQGWLQFAAADFHLERSDQSFPADQPALRAGTPLREFLWAVRAQANDTATVNQFVRAFALTAASAVAAPAPEPERFLTVIMRTQGRRDLSLLDALTCLAAQTDDDFEICLMVHSPEADVADHIRQLVARFAPEFAGRVRVHLVTAGGRARPLNVGLGEAVGRYIAFLDDDDLVTADWVESFRNGTVAAPGQMVRSVVADRPVRRVAAGELPAPYVAQGGLVLNHATEFDFVDHLFTNRTPFCSFAVPTSLARELHIAFQEDLPVVEDWDFLLRVAMLAGVRDTGRVTSIYHRWAGTESSLGALPAVVWSTARRMVLQRLDAAPLLLPVGSASRLADHLEREVEQTARLRAEVEELRHVRALHDTAVAQFAALEQHADSLRNDIGRANWEAERIRGSKFWRVSAPVRRSLDLLRALTHRTGSSGGG